MDAAAILDFQKFEMLTISPVYGSNTRHHAKFHQNRSNGCRDSDLTVFAKWRPSAILDLLSEIGTTPMTSWWYLSLCKRECSCKQVWTRNSRMRSRRLKKTSRRTLVLRSVVWQSMSITAWRSSLAERGLTRGDVKSGAWSTIMMTGYEQSFADTVMDICAVHESTEVASDGSTHDPITSVPSTTTFTAMLFFLYAWVTLSGLALIGVTTSVLHVVLRQSQWAPLTRFFTSFLTTS